MEVMTNIYKNNSNLTKSKLSSYLKKDLLWSAETCLKNGLVDAIYS